MPTRRRKTSLLRPRKREVANEQLNDDNFNFSSDKQEQRMDCDPLRARLGAECQLAAIDFGARLHHHYHRRHQQHHHHHHYHHQAQRPTIMRPLSDLLGWSNSITRSLVAIVLIVLTTSVDPNLALRSHQLVPSNEYHQSSGQSTALEGLLEVATGGARRRTFNDVTLRQRHRRQQRQRLAEPAALKYHLNHLQPPSLVPITVERRQTTTSDGSAPSTSPTTNQPTASNHRQQQQQRRHPSSEALTGAFEPMASAASNHEAKELVQVQLPLQLHLRLRPLALPQPPPLAASSSSSPDATHLAGKQRRSLEANSALQFGDKQQKRLTLQLAATQQQQQQQEAAASAPAATFLLANGGGAEAGAQTALGWQEAKRVLLMNSLAPPLVQLASRRLGRRFVAGMPPTPQESAASQAASAKTPAASGQDVTTTTFTSLVTTTPVAQTGGQLVEANGRPASTTTTTTTLPTTKREQIIQLSEATGQQPTKRTDDQMEEATRKQRLVSQQVERLGDDIESLQRRHKRPHLPLENTRPVSAGDDESRIQSMAAAMLPFVWPSFQLTAGSLKAAAASKLKARSLASSNAQPTSATTTSPQTATWPMKYQQLERASPSSSTTSTTARAPAQASELRPTVVAADNDEEEARVRRRELSTSKPTTNTTTTTTTTTSAPTSNSSTTTIALSSKKKPLRSNKKRLKSANHLQAASKQTPGAETTPAYEDSTRLASKYPMPRIKFNGSSTLSAVSNHSSESSSVKLDSAQAQPASNGTNKSNTSGFQMPRSLIRLIEQQQLLASIDGTTTKGKQTAALLQYIAAQQQQQQQQSGAKVSTTTGKRFPSTPAPTTSVSKVVRLMQPTTTTAVLEIEVNSTNSVSFTSKPSPGVTQKSTVSPTWPAGAANRTFALMDLKRTIKENVPTTTTSMAPMTTPQPPPLARNISRLNVTEALPGLATQSSGEQRRSLEEPPTSGTSSVFLDSSTQLTPISITTTTTTTTSRPTTTSGTTFSPSGGGSSSTAAKQQALLMAAEEEQIGNNKVLPDEEETTATTAIVTSTTTTSKPRKFGGATGGHTPATQAQLNNKNNHQLNKPTSQASGHTTNAKSQIKLFHFKRKPDVAKLPFYKKPLNFTELGWTAEEIERELARQRAEGELSADNDSPARSKKSTRMTINGKSSLAGGESSGEPQPDDDDEQQESDESAAASARASSVDKNAAPVAESGLTPLENSRLLLLKRKRRAKNQFERLMAELQEAAAAAAAAAPTTGESSNVSSSQSANFKARLTGDEWRVPAAGALAVSSNDEFINSELVPVLRKKQEPLVMKPMFFVMNQKRRAMTTSSALPQSSVNETVSRPAQRSAANSTLDEESQLLQQRSKPIVRMRRKHHGEQPELSISAGSPSQSAWRPSKPDWLPPSNTQPRVMLVPSGLLTPSGSHPMPLFAPDSSVWPSTGTQRNNDLSNDGEQQRDVFVVAPSSSPVTVHDHHHHQHEQPLAQPPPPPPQQASQQPVASQMSAASPQPPTVSQLMGSPTSELRVPKLLVKPMRPAKYSLNGYIPKPSLTNALGHQQQTQHQAQVSTAIMSQRTPLLNAANQQQQQQQQQVMQTSRSPQAQSMVQPALTPNANHNSAANGRSSSKPLKRHSMPSSRPSAVSGAQSSSASSLLAAGAANFQNKDLDSSTSNEIFSRRRGLQQQQRSPNSIKRNISFESLLTSSSSSPAAGANAFDEQPLLVVGASSTSLSARNDSALLPAPLLSADKQMEANRRKYVKQHQASSAFKSPTLSLQRANQIKAKLGLSSSFAPGSSSRRAASDKLEPAAADNQQLASANSIAHLEPAASETDDLAETSKLLIGAPLNTIPKTDFECTDSRGRFKAGLFADTKTGCQVWHLCSNNRKYSFLCPSGTIFNAKVRICDWRYNVKCE